MRALGQDLRHAARSLRKSPGFTIIAVLTLALGIGANTAIYSVMDAVLLRPLAYRDPARLTLLGAKERKPEARRIPIAPPAFVDLRTRATSFEALGAVATGRFTVSGGEGPELVSGAIVSADVLGLLGVPPALGRGFVPDEERPGQGQAAVLSDSLWRRRFGADPGVLGRPIVVDGQSFTVVGVMPRGYALPQAISFDAGAPTGRHELFLPLTLDPAQLADENNRYEHYLMVLGRLRPGVAVSRAAEDVDAIARQMGEAHPRTDAAFGVTVEPLADTVIGSVRPALLVLLGAVALVLLIGCANAANLLLARGAARRRELAIRAALGASRSRLVRQLLTESVFLSLVAGTLGLLMASWGVDALMALSPGNVAELRAIGINGRVLAFAVGLSLATGVLFGLLPALALSRTRLVEPMQGTAPPLRMRARGLLVVGEVGLAFLLLCGAGLLVRSFDHLTNVDPGFTSRDVVTMSVTLPAERYADGARIGELWRSLDERLKSRPEAAVVGLTTHVPLAAAWQIAISIQGRPPASPGEILTAFNWVVTPGYFRAMGIRLREGRILERTDDGRHPVVVVSRGFAARYWPGENALGKRIKWGPADSPRPWLEVVGIVDDVRGDQIQGAAGPDVYMPLAQLEPMSLFYGARSMTIVAKAAGSPQALLSALRDEVRSLDPQLAPARPAPLDEVLASAVAEPRFRTQLIGLLATIAMVLASIGIYGVVAFAVAQRTREIGIRMALGARRSHVIGMVVRQALGLAVAGVLAGAALSVGLTRVLSSFLYEVSPTDPATFGAIALLLCTIAGLASWQPARRATRIDPMLAFRSE